MAEPTIIGKPSILIVDNNPEWLEFLEFNLGDQYLLVATPVLAKANEIAQRHWPDVMLLNETIARQDPEAARIGIQKDGGIQLPTILITGFEKPELKTVAHEIGGCIAIVDRLAPFAELEHEITKVVRCAETTETAALTV